MAAVAVLGVAGIATAASTTTAASKKPIKIFVYGDLTYPAPAQPQVPVQDIPAAFLKNLNATGGINGAKVEMTFCDSKLNPNQTTACARQALAGDYAAIINPLSQAGAGGANTLFAKSGIPLIHYIPGVDELPETNAICSSPGFANTTISPGTLARINGVKTVAVAAVDLPGITAYLPKIVKGFENQKIKVTSSQSVPVSTTDYSPVWAKAMADKPDAVYYLNAEPVLSSGSKQFRAAYPNTKLILPLVQTPTLKAIGSNGKGILSSYPYFGMSSGAPGIAEFNRVVKKYGKHATEDLQDANVGMWLTMKLFEGIAKQVKGTVNAKSLLKAFDTAKNVSTGGITPNYNGKARGQFGVPCQWDRYFVPSTIKDGKLVSLQPTGTFTDIGTGKAVKKPS